QAMTHTRSNLLVAATVLALTGCAGDRYHESTGEVVDDAVITTKVKARFVEDKEVSALNIGVDTKKGVVLLSRIANSPHEAWKARQRATHVRGVEWVHNETAVRSTRFAQDRAGRHAPFRLFHFRFAIFEGGTMTHHLPDLPWAADALAPHMSRKTLELHHGKH